MFVMMSGAVTLGVRSFQVASGVNAKDLTQISSEA